MKLFGDDKRSYNQLCDDASNADAWYLAIVPVFLGNVFASNRTIKISIIKHPFRQQRQWNVKFHTYTDISVQYIFFSRIWFKSDQNHEPASKLISSYGLLFLFLEYFDFPNVSWMSGCVWVWLFFSFHDIFDGNQTKMKIYNLR